MRILLPVHHFPPRYSAGAELYTLRLGKALQQMGHEVAVVTFESIDSGPTDALETRQDEMEGLTVWRLSFNLMESPDRQTANFDNPLLEAWFANYLQTNRPDVIHFQAGYLLGVAPMRAAHRLGVPSLLTLHDYWFLCPRHTLLRSDGTLCEQIPTNPAACAWCHVSDNRRSQMLNRLSLGLWEAVNRRFMLRDETAAQTLRRRALAEAIAWPQVLLAPSQYMATRMREIAGTKPIRNWPIGLEGIGEPATIINQRMATIRVPDGILRVGYVGQVASHKGVGLLIEAWHRLTGAQPRELHIHGGASSEEYAQELRTAAGNDSSIYFHGRFTHTERDAILAGLDVVVAPSIWYENRPFAISEALAAGVPVLTARLGGMAEMVQDGIDGLHFAPNDAASLAAALQRLLDDAELLKTLREGASMYTPLSVPDEAQNLVALYQQAIDASALQNTPHVAVADSY